MSVEDIKLKKILLKIIIEFDSICKKNNLTYYIIGGTLLGAIRHKGFIPWDDDIDIGMPRESFDKFLKIYNKILPNYLAVVKKRAKNDPMLYIKLCDSRTTIIESIPGIETNFVEGVFIDIFPIDGGGNNLILANLKAYIINKLYNILILNLIDFKCKKSLRKKCYLHRMLKIISNWLGRDKFIYLIRKIINIILKYPQYNKSKYVGNFLGSYGYKEIVKRAYFENGKLYQFESTLLIGPYDGDKYLWRIYGDYMQFPPENKRISHHNYIFVSLEKRYSS